MNQLLEHSARDCLHRNLANKGATIVHADSENGVRRLADEEVNSFATWSRGARPSIGQWPKSKAI